MSADLKSVAKKTPFELDGSFLRSGKALTLISLDKNLKISFYRFDYEEFEFKLETVSTELVAV